MASEVKEEDPIPAKLVRPRRSSAELASRTWVSQNAEKKAHEKRIKLILKKSEGERSDVERALLDASQEMVAELAKRARQRQQVKKKMEEIEDSADILADKTQELADVLRRARHLVVYTGAGVSTLELERQLANVQVLSAYRLADRTQELADVLRQARHLVVYTGAGVSTAASIPDYRGPNGVWTLLQKGLDVKTTSLVDAEPTLTHMSLVKLHHKGLVQHIVSQNCDGLHLRSGFPQDALSEVHGNMFIEVCIKCKPERVYTRLFDVTEHTAKFRHDTGRKCHKCRGPLRDSIVHFGEKGAVEKPLNWRAAIDAAEDADVILCLGSSLKVLRRYPFLWGTDRCKAQRPKLYIVNLQWTPKDTQATLKINGKCDQVMKMVMEKLGLDIPCYQRSTDPIFTQAIPLKPHELKTFSTKMLQTMCNNNNTDLAKSECKVQLPTENTVTEVNSVKNEVKEEIFTIKPGWFGKGCRKRVTKRRRSSQVSIEEVKEEKKE